MALINTSNDGNTGTNRVKHYWGARDGNYCAKGTISAGAFTCSGTANLNGYVNISTNSLSMNDKPIYLRSTNGSDVNHYLQYSSGLDGPILSGYGGGSLKAGPSGSKTTALSWNTSSVTIPGTLNMSSPSSHQIKTTTAQYTTTNASYSGYGYAGQQTVIVLATNNLTITLNYGNWMDGTLIIIRNLVVIGAIV
jgi:hypothetical protein